MLPTNQRLLIVITGPVGAGKSSTSLALARSLRRPDFAVAAIDLDQMYCLTRPIDAKIVRYFFTLRLSYEHTLERVQGDPSRGASKDPSFLKSLHAYFAQALPFLEAESVVIDTDELAQDEVVARL